MLWLVGLAIGALFGFAWGRSSAPDRYREGYAAGHETCRQRTLQVAREHDFAMIELRMQREEQ